MTDGVFAMPAATATAHVHLLKPAVPLRDLDAHAEPAIRELEDGAFTAMVIDERHHTWFEGKGATASRAGSC